MAGHSSLLFNYSATLEQQTDLYSFLFENLGVKPKW